MFGEASCLYRTPHSATIVATRDCYMLEVLRNILDQLQKDPVYKAKSDEVYKQRVLQLQLRQLPIFSELTEQELDQVRNAAFDRVVVTAPDRLARNSVHQMLLIEEFEQCGCQIEFIDQPMSHNPHDQLLVQIRGAVAEYERNLIAERM